MATPSFTTSEQDAAPVPLSPNDRRNSLEKALQQRPEVKELKDRGILLDTNAAPSLQAVQLELERQLATDSLKKGLSQRPEKGELVERNILSASAAAPSLQSSAKNLERHMRRDSLEKQLQRRPPPEDLVEKGVLIDQGNALSPKGQ